jgi:hypothetical protein
MFLNWPEFYANPARSLLCGNACLLPQQQRQHLEKYLENRGVVED